MQLISGQKAIFKHLHFTIWLSYILKSLLLNYVFSPSLANNRTDTLISIYYLLIHSTFLIPLFDVPLIIYFATQSSDGTVTASVKSFIKIVGIGIWGGVVVSIITVFLAIPVVVAIVVLSK